MRISVFGNCQASPLRSYISNLTGAETPPCPLNYQVTNGDEDSVLTLFQSSDIVFAQRIDETFGVRWARTSSLKSCFPNKLLVWPNIYFDGYYPDIRYLYRPNGKIVGPVSDYHFDGLLDCFHQRKTVQEAVRLFSSGEILSRYPDPVGRSLAELRNRERDCDVHISDQIESSHAHEMIQFTPNHPKSTVLIEMARRLCRAAGIKSYVETAALVPELDYVYVPPYSAIADTLKLDNFDASFRGVEIELNEGKITLGARRSYDLRELVNAYYSIYRTAFGEGNN